MNLLFLDQDIFELLGLGDIDAERKAKLLTRINNVVGDRILYRVMDELSETDKAEFGRLVDGEAGEKAVNEFLSGKVDLKPIIVEEVTEFKERMAKDVASLKEAIK